MNKTWIVVGALVGAMMVTTVGGVALAQSSGDAAQPAPSAEPTAAKTSHRTFASRLAEKLGLSEDKVSDAIKSVCKDVLDEKVSARLSHAVEAGKLTQADADAYLTWWKARPNAFPAGPGCGPVGPPPHPRLGHHADKQNAQMPDGIRAWRESGAAGFGKGPGRPNTQPQPAVSA